MKKLMILLAFISHTVFAQWQLQPEKSAINFLSIKKEHIAEIHTFQQFSGSISQTGDAILSIDLASVDTAIDIRNERMKQHLFQTALYPKASMTSKIDINYLLKLLAKENVINSEFIADINLHGVSKQLAVKVKIFKLAEDEITVVSQTPMLLKADDFALVAGINKLKELAGLASISQVVPVNFTLTFRQVH